MSPKFIKVRSDHDGDLQCEVLKVTPKTIKVRLPKGVEVWSRWTQESFIKGDFVLRYNQVEKAYAGPGGLNSALWVFGTVNAYSDSDCFTAWVR